MQVRGRNPVPYMHGDGPHDAGRKGGMMDLTFGRSAKTPDDVARDADDKKVPAGVTAFLCGWFRGAPIGADAVGTAIYDTAGKASTAGNDVRVTLANRGIWTTGGTYEVPAVLEPVLDEQGEPVLD